MIDYNYKVRNGQNKSWEDLEMLAINMDDVINVLNSCKPYLIALGVVLALAIVVTVACMKLKKPVKKLVRKEAWIAFLLAVVVIVNLICFIPM